MMMLAHAIRALGLRSGAVCTRRQYICTRDAKALHPLSVRPRHMPACYLPSASLVTSKWWAAKKKSPSDQKDDEGGDGDTMPADSTTPAKDRDERPADGSTKPDSGDEPVKQSSSEHEGENSDDGPGA